MFTSSGGGQRRVLSPRKHLRNYTFRFLSSRVSLSLNVCTLMNERLEVILFVFFPPTLMVERLEVILFVLFSPSLVESLEGLP